MKSILHLDSSGRHEASLTRKLSSQIIDSIKGNSKVVYRDVGKGISFVNDSMIAGYNTAEDKRTAEQKKSLALSDEITKELFDNDVYVFGIPIYNFSMPATFKAWCDLAARAGVTFKYTKDGPVGLLKNKKAYIALASGGTKLGSKIDFLTPWLCHYLAFIGIEDIEIIAADAVGRDSALAIAKAEARIRNLKTI